MISGVKISEFTGTTLSIFIVSLLSSLDKRVELGAPDYLYQYDVDEHCHDDGVYGRNKEIENDMFLIDQHAGHERILYEQIKENYKNHLQNNSQLMLIPEVYNLSHKEIEFVKENIELFNDIIQALEKGNISNDKDGALDLAWHINGGSEYGFYDFSVESNLRAQRRLSEETNPNNVFWTTNRQFKFAKTYPALLGIFEKAEQENPDFADEINIYQEEIKNQEVYLNEEVTQVIQAMNELTNKLLEY